MMINDNSSDQSKTPRNQPLSCQALAATGEHFLELSSCQSIWRLPKIGYPQIIQFKRLFHYKPSILRMSNF